MVRLRLDRTLFAGVSLLLPLACLETAPIEQRSTLVLEIDEEGVISSDEAPLKDIQGQWYVYGDAYGNPRSCIDVGQHRAEDCSFITQPVAHVPNLDFPNRGGKMCVSGVVARVLECCTEASDPDDPDVQFCRGENTVNCFEAEDDDYSTMWGAGLGFDFDLPVPKDGVRGYNEISARVPWDANKEGIRGIAFELEWHAPDNEIPLRVEFPVITQKDVPLPEGKGTVILTGTDELTTLLPEETFPAGSSTEGHPLGSPFWQEREPTREWELSPIHEGVNVIEWAEVFGPPIFDDPPGYMEGEPFTGDRLMGLQFHVITDPGSERSFSFCISDLRFLTD